MSVHKPATQQAVATAEKMRFSAVVVAMTTSVALGFVYEFTKHTPHLRRQIARKNRRRTFVLAFGSRHLRFPKRMSRFIWRLCARLQSPGSSDTTW